MAFKITIKDAMADKKGILFDTNALIDAFKQGKGGPLRQNIVAIDFNKRFVTELVLWEFLCDAQIPGADRASRRDWLDKEVKIRLHDQPAGYFATLQALTKNSASRGGGIDGQLAAYSVSTSGTLALATNNVKDFCWHDAIPIVEEFITSSTTPLNCK